MDGIKEEDIERLTKEAVDLVGVQGIYSLALMKVNLAKLKEAEPISAEEHAMTFSLAGFIAGIQFTLKYLHVEETEDEKDKNE